MIVTRKNLQEARKKALTQKGLTQVQSVCPFLAPDGREYIILGCPNDIAFALWSDVRYYAKAKSAFELAIEEAKLIYCKFSDRAPFFAPVFDQPGTCEWTPYLEGHATADYLESLELSEEDFFGECGSSGEDIEPPVDPALGVSPASSKTRKK